MQKITYINAYGERLVFGGEPPVLLRSVTGLGRTDAAIVKAQGAYQAGEFFSRLQLPARYRSEERRVGKECRSRWSPYH